MADDENIGKWKTAELLDPWPPEWLEDFKSKVDTIAQFLIASLELANVMLDVIKAFLIGINDPITALIKALIKEIEKILKDLRQLGLYFTSDRKLMDYPFKDILGGFQGAEKRMIGRLNDRTDIGRPDVSPNTLMVGFMFYASADTNGLYNLLSVINKILALFSFEVSGNKFSTVQNLSVSYSASDPTYTPTFGQGVFSPPREIVVSWQQVKNANIMGINIPLPGPANFIIEVSTVPYGLPLFITKQDTNKASPGGKNGEGTPQLKTYELTERKLGVEQQVYLCGGADRLSYPSQYNYETATDSDGKLKDGSAYVHTFLADNQTQPIPIHLLKDSSGTEPTYFLQRTFVLGVDDGGGAVTTFGTQSTFKIKPEQLPKSIKVSGTGSSLKIEEDTEETPTIYYFRVTPSAKFDTTPFARYSVESKNVDSENNVVTNSVSIGSPSSIFPLKVARDTTSMYQESVESALLALLLSRPDLDNLGRETPFLSEDKDKLLGIFGIDPRKFFSSDIGIVQFRNKVRRIVKRLTTELIDKTGVLPKLVEEFVVDSSQELREFTWSDFNVSSPSLTLRQSVGMGSSSTIDFNDEIGIAPNLKAIPYEDNREHERKFRKLIIGGTKEPTYPSPPPTQTVEIQKSVRDSKLQSLSKGNPNGGIFEKRKAEQYDYLLNGSLKDSQGNDRVIIRVGVEYVLMREKADYISTKKISDSSGNINGNSPLVYASRSSMNSGFRISPALSQSTPMYFTRTVLIDHNNGQLLQQAALVLNIASSSSDKKAESEWDFVRLGDNGVMLFVEQFLNTILNTVQAILDGLQGIIDNILRFIDFIQQRINEVQNLIRKINAIIQSIGLFDIPSVSMLFFASKGTDGVTRDLVSAQDKPSDPTTAYGFGAMGLMPIPVANVILDLFFPDTDIEGLVDDIVSGEE